jgi:hypothetical protein
MALRRTRVSVNSLMRQAKCLFSPKITKHLQIQLPTPLPFSGIEFEPRQVQRALLNRTAMRVADRREVSGRVTAEDVSLERIHYSFRKVCTLVASFKLADWRRVP